MRDKWLDTITDDELTQLLQTPQEQVPLTLKKRIIDEASKQKNPSVSYFTPLRLATAAIFVMFIPLLVFNFFGIFRATPQNRVVYINGDLYLNHSGQEKIADYDSIIQQGDQVRAPINSEAALNLAEAYFVSVYPDSNLFLLELEQKASLVALEKGALLSSSLNNTNYSYQIKTPHALITPTGTRFYVSCNTEKTYIHVEEGQVEIQETENNSTSVLSAHESLVISMNGKSQKTILKDRISELYKLQEKLLQLEMKKQRYWLTIEAEPEDITLQINEWEFLLHKKLAIKLEAGTYKLSFIKPGYKSESLTIHLAQDTPPVIVSLEAKPEKTTWRGIGLESPIKPSEKNWQHQLIYRNHSDRNSNPAILGFALSPNYFAAITETGIMCFDKQEQLLWTKNYPPEKEVLFKGLPIIQGDQLLASTFDKLIVINLKTASERIIFSPGVLLQGQTPVVSQDNILFAFAAGIYKFDLDNMQFDYNPFVLFENSTMPLVTTNSIISASSLSSELCVYNLKGQKQKCSRLGDYFYSSPVKMGDYIYLADNLAWLHQLSSDLEKENSIRLEGRIYSLVPGNHDFLYAFSDTGTLFNVNTREQEIKWQIQIDDLENQQTGVYAYKKPVAVNDEIMIGTDKGDILAVKSQQGEKNLCLKASKAAVTTAIYPYYDFCLIGTASGEIIKLENR